MKNKAAEQEGQGENRKEGEYIFKVFLYTDEKVTNDEIANKICAALHSEDNSIIVVPVPNPPTPLQPSGTGVPQYCAYCSKPIPIKGQRFYNADGGLVFCSQECLMKVCIPAIASPSAGHRDSKEDNSEEEKVTPEEIKAIAETSLILYIRKLQEVNANAIQKIAEELRNKATLKETIAQQEQRIKDLELQLGRIH